MGVASGSATVYGTVALSGICFLVLFFYMGEKEFKLQTVEQKKELEDYKKDIMYRKLLHTLNSIVKQLEKTGDSKEIEKLFENIRFLHSASQGDVSVEPEIDEIAEKTRLFNALVSVVPDGGDN